MIVNQRHIGLSVTDIEIGIKFYESLGGRLMSRDEERGYFIESLLGIQGVILNTAKLKFADNSRLELMQFINPRSSSNKNLITSLGLHHIAFTVDNLDLAIKLILAGGGTMIGSPIKVTPSHSIHAVSALHVYAKDPFENLIHLAEDFNEHI